MLDWYAIIHIFICQGSLVTSFNRLLHSLSSFYPFEILKKFICEYARILVCENTIRIWWCSTTMNVSAICEIRSGCQSLLQRSRVLVAVMVDDLTRGMKNAKNVWSFSWQFFLQLTSLINLLRAGINGQNKL